MIFYIILLFNSSKTFALTRFLYRNSDLSTMGRNSLCIYISKDDTGQTVPSEVLAGSWGRSRKSSLPTPNLIKVQQWRTWWNISSAAHVGISQQVQTLYIKILQPCINPAQWRKAAPVFPQLCSVFPKEHILKHAFIGRIVSTPSPPTLGCITTTKHHKSLNYSQ